MKSILDRSRYSKKTIDTFEIIAAYFIDVYYNHFYIEAKHLRNNGQVSSITEGYKRGLLAYGRAIDDHNMYKRILKNLHEFFQECGFSSITFSECIDHITKEFIPEDYYHLVSRNQKASILKMIICNSNSTFIEKIAQEYIKMIIDNHKEADNVRVMQDDFIELLIYEREKMYTLFITRGQSKGRNDAMIQAMQAEIKKLCAEKFSLKKMIIGLKKIILSKDSEVKSQNIKSQELEKKIQDLQLELDNLRSSSSTLRPSTPEKVTEPSTELDLFGPPEPKSETLVTAEPALHESVQEADEEETHALQKDDSSSDPKSKDDEIFKFSYDEQFGESLNDLF